eukprot:COSAG01_NODE_138_length_24329_cov_45.428229_3_plen_80_part_00
MGLCIAVRLVQPLERIFVRPLGFGQPVLVPGLGGALGPQELMAGVVAFGGQGVHGRTEWGQVGYSTHLGMAAGSDLRYC